MTSSPWRPTAGLVLALDPMFSSSLWDKIAASADGDVEAISGATTANAVLEALNAIYEAAGKPRSPFSPRADLPAGVRSF